MNGWERAFSVPMSTPVHRCGPATTALIRGPLPPQAPHRRAGRHEVSKPPIKQADKARQCTHSRVSSIIRCCHRRPGGQVQTLGIFVIGRAGLLFVLSSLADATWCLPRVCRVQVPDVTFLPASPDALSHTVSPIRSLLQSLLVSLSSSLRQCGGGGGVHYPRNGCCIRGNFACYLRGWAPRPFVPQSARWPITDCVGAQGLHASTIRTWIQGREIAGQPISLRLHHFRTDGRPACSRASGRRVCQATIRQSSPEKALVRGVICRRSPPAPPGQRGQ